MLEKSNPITLLAQNEEIFKRMSEDFDRLAEAIEHVQQNHQTLSASVLKVGSKYDDLIRKQTHIDATFYTFEKDIKRFDFGLKNLDHQFGDLRSRYEALQVQLNDSIPKLKLQLAQQRDEYLKLQDGIDSKITTLDTSINSLRNENQLLIAENNKLKNRVYIAGGIAIVSVILQFIEAYL